MDRIKENALSIQTQITKMLTDSLNEMHDIVQKKTSVLKADHHELTRQYQEIMYVQSFLKAQADEAAPLEFLQLNTGHAQIKDQIQRQWPKVSADLADDKYLMQLNGKPIITVTETNAQLKDTQNLKQSQKSVTDRQKSQVEYFNVISNFKGNKKFSSKFRETLFQQQGRLNENVIFNQSQGIMDL